MSLDTSMPFEKDPYDAMDEDNVVVTKFWATKTRSNSSIVLNKDTALNPDLCSKRKIERDFYNCV